MRVGGSKTESEWGKQMRLDDALARQEWNNTDAVEQQYDYCCEEEYNI